MLAKRPSTALAPSGFQPWPYLKQMAVRHGLCRPLLGAFSGQTNEWNESELHKRRTYCFSCNNSKHDEKLESVGYPTEFQPASPYLTGQPHHWTQRLVCWI